MGGWLSATGLSHRCHRPSKTSLDRWSSFYVDYLAGDFIRSTSHAPAVLTRIITRLRIRCRYDSLYHHQRSQSRSCKGSATGAINFLVFTLSALMAPAYGWLLNTLAVDSHITMESFREAGIVGIVGIIMAIILSCFIKETGSQRYPEMTVKAK